MSAALAGTGTATGIDANISNHSGPEEIAETRPAKGAVRTTPQRIAYSVLKEEQEQDGFAGHTTLLAGKNHV